MTGASGSVALCFARATQSETRATLQSLLYKASPRIRTLLPAFTTPCALRLFYLFLYTS